MTALPIEAILPELRKQMAGHPACLLIAQPGAGKTTRVPLALLNDPGLGKGRWLMLEPRRVATRLAASHMAAQSGEAVGRRIGYRVRGEQRVSAGTQLEILTQGIFTRMLQDDPLLEGVAGVIFDEFHERSLDADLGLTLALEIQRSVRPDLKILIMSATLDVDSLLAVLGKQTPVLDCPGRVWPVTTIHCPPPAQGSRRGSPWALYAQHQAEVIRRAMSEHEGNVLVFLPGQKEIRALQQKLSASLPPTSPDNVEICPLHGQMPLQQQQQVLQLPESGRRRVILSTDIAESSLTVPGVRIVIDCGLQRVPVFQPRSGLTRLETRRVNRASADQRRGRAGREAAGCCYRLWPESDRLAAHSEPEIVQADLAPLVFELCRWGERDMAAASSRLPWVTPPPLPALGSAQTLLQQLDLLQADGGLSSFGQRAQRWPTHPRLAVLMQRAAESSNGELLPLACWTVSWLEENAGGLALDLSDILQQRPTRDGPGNAGRWYRAARMWAGRAACSLAVDDRLIGEGLAFLLAHAFPDRIAQRQEGGATGRPVYKLVSGGQALLPEQHALGRAQFLVAFEVDGQTSAARIFHAVALPVPVLESVFPATLEWDEVLTRDTESGAVKAERQRRLGPLVLERKPLASVPRELLQQSLLEALRQRGSFNWSQDDRQLLGRLRLLHQHKGDTWPDVSDEALLSTLEQWLLPYLNDVHNLQGIDALPLGRFLHDSLPWDLQKKLSHLAPVTLTVPSGNSIRIDYSGEEPVLAVKLQELFGLEQTPAILDGRLPLLLHLLSPARRPVQMTRDLAGFWKSTYFEVRKDLKGRYPKHPWPDEPMTATPTHRTRKHSA